MDEDTGAGAVEEILDSSATVSWCIVMLKHPVISLPADRTSSADRLPQSAHHTQVVSCCDALPSEDKLLEDDTG